MQVIDGPLRMRCRRKDGALVVAENLEPAIEIACVVGAWFQFRDDAKIGAKKAAPKFRDQFFAGAFAPVFSIAAEVTIKPPRCSGPVHVMPISA